MKKALKLKRVFLMLMVAIAFSACESDSDLAESQNNDIPATVSFSQQNASRSMAQNELTLTSTKILVSQMEFENDMEDDGMAEDSLEFETEPFVVELNSGKSTTVESTLPIGGEFDEIEIEIETLDDEDIIIDPIFVDGENHYSIVANGTFMGVDFTFRSDLEIELEMDLEPALVVEAGVPVNVDIFVDTAQWFMAADGSVLDPTLLENKTIIEANIKNSFQASEVDDD